MSWNAYVDSFGKVTPIVCKEPITFAAPVTILRTWGTER